MKEETVLKLAITPHFRVSIDNEDGTTTDWRLCLDYRALARIEDKTGLDLKDIKVWQAGIPSKQFPLVVWGALQRFNPEVEPERVLDVLDPGVQRILADQLLELCFPGIRKSYEKLLNDQKETGATASPNVPTVETPTA